MIQDADHYGLEKIKRRLIEYLAVLRLKTLQAVKEAELAPLTVPGLSPSTRLR